MWAPGPPVLCAGPGLVASVENCGAPYWSEHTPIAQTPLGIHALKTCPDGPWPRCHPEVKFQVPIPIDWVAPCSQLAHEVLNSPGIEQASAPGSHRQVTHTVWRERVPCDPMCAHFKQHRNRSVWDHLGYGGSDGGLAPASQGSSLYQEGCHDCMLFSVLQLKSCFIFFNKTHAQRAKFATSRLSLKVLKTMLSAKGTWSQMADLRCRSRESGSKYVVV